jgi:response regulator RpfG family c-di-GMP phosphodiesterase
VSPPLPAERPRILLVDDDPNVLDALRRTLRGSFDVAAAQDPQVALDLLAGSEPFPVVVSDLMMPGMNGVELLTRARALAPDSVRVLLTGHADLGAALAAVNEGHVFRFLTKPVDARLLRRNLEAAVEQHRLIVGERVLLRETLHGSVRALIELLGLTNPHVFGRATAIKQRAVGVAARLGATDDWTIGVAAMLSQVGLVTLPPETVAKLYCGRILNDDERRAVDELPAVVERLLGAIPRLEPVREILAFQDGRFQPRGCELPLGARILKAVTDFCVLESQGCQRERALGDMRARRGWYDPAVVDALEEVLAAANTHPRMTHSRVCDLALGYVLAEDLVTDSGMLLLARGQEVNPAILARVKNSWADIMGDRLLSVIRPGAEAAVEDAPSRA